MPQSTNLTRESAPRRHGPPSTGPPPPCSRGTRWGRDAPTPMPRRTRHQQEPDERPSAHLST
eukprot:6716724-Alexandrium_andersonii.AAC.1